MIRLDIGSGGKGNNGFIGVDAYAEDADVKALMWDLPFEDNSVDVIVSSQALEHISKFDVIPTLKEWYRVLKPGGMIQVFVPDLEWAVEFWLTRKDLPDSTSWPMDIIFGSQEHDGMYHKTGFTPKILWQYFHLSGKWFIYSLEYYTPINPEYDVTQRCIRIQAEKWDENKNYEDILKEKGD